MPAESVVDGLKELESPLEQIPAGNRLGSDGVLYATTFNAGARSRGGIIRVGIDGSGFEVTHSFGDTEARTSLRRSSGCR